MVLKHEKKSMRLNVIVVLSLLAVVSVLRAQEQRQINSINFDHERNWNRYYKQ